MLETVVINKSDYDELLYASRKLNALEAGGVDNWEWYGEAMASLYDEEDDDFVRDED